MLTKDLLINSKKGGKIFPHAVKTDRSWLSHGQDLINTFQSHRGRPFYELKESLLEIAAPHDKVKAGFEKILTDHTEFEENSEVIEATRWQIITTAQKLRDAGISDYKLYQESIAQSFDRDPNKVEKDLYGDLAEYRRIKTPPHVSSTWLIHRYNLAQIQGLVLRATRITIAVDEINLPTKRALFRTLKFHRLLPDKIAEYSGGLSFDLTGPLNIFDMAQTYGLRFANFIPHIVQMKKFKVHCEVKINQEYFDLTFDHSSGLISHYKELGGYIPEEFLLCLENFNKKYQPGKAKIADSFLDLGGQSYCFPDIVLQAASNSQPIYIEIFHRWHHGQLKSRLAQLEKHPVDNLRLGICQSIIKKGEMKECIEASHWGRDKIFSFREFPTPKKLAELLAT